MERASWVAIQQTNSPILDRGEAMAQAAKMKANVESKQIVKDIYRKRYKDAGDPKSCNDWLAKTLAEHFHASAADKEKDVKKGQFDYDGFATCLEENNVPMTGKWAELYNSTEPGWQGRFRMNGRQKLEKVVYEKGFLKVKGKKLTPDSSWMSNMKERHPKWGLTDAQIKEANDKQKQRRTKNK